MKHPRIFLSLTTACLAIAGIVAAKVNYFGPFHIAYYTPSGTTSCLSTKVTCILDFNTTAICTIHGTTVYTDYYCIQKLTYSHF